jgi:hypothetical protein
MMKVATIFFTLLMIGGAVYLFETGNALQRDSIQFALIILCFLYLRHPEFMKWLKRED